jgi:hypothetical protein
MSWFDEAVARRRRMQRAANPAKARQEANPVDWSVRQRQEVEALHPLMERLLSEYGDHVYGRSFTQKRYVVRLEHPGKSRQKSWNWHWHLDSLVRNLSGVEVHPCFANNNTLHKLVLMSGHKRIEVNSLEEDAIKEALVSLYLQ